MKQTCDVYAGEQQIQKQEVTGHPRSRRVIMIRRDCSTPRAVKNTSSNSTGDRQIFFIIRFSTLHPHLDPARHLFSSVQPKHKPKHEHECTRWSRRNEARPDGDTHSSREMHAPVSSITFSRLGPLYSLFRIQNCKNPFQNGSRDMQPALPMIIRSSLARVIATLNLSKSQLMPCMSTAVTDKGRVEIVPKMQVARLRSPLWLKDQPHIRTVITFHKPPTRPHATDNRDSKFSSLIRLHIAHVHTAKLGLTQSSTGSPYLFSPRGDDCNLVLLQVLDVMQERLNCL